VETNTNQKIMDGVNQKKTAGAAVATTGNKAAATTAVKTAAARTKTVDGVADERANNNNNRGTMVTRGNALNRFPWNFSKKEAGKRTPRKP